MAATIAPADEACQALVARINAGTDYVLDVDATYSRLLIDPLEDIQELRVDVVADTEQGQSDRLDGLDTSLHTIKVWVRAPLPDPATEFIADLALLRKQISDWLDNWDSNDRRVRVWDSENDDLEQPLKDAVRQSGLFVAVVVLNVQVEP